jgi:hypothetical protein
MQLMLRSWTRFLARLFPGRRTSRQRLSRWWAGARKLACPTLRRGRKRRLLRQPLRPLALQGLEPRQLLSASLQVFYNGTQITSGGSDSFGTVTVGSYQMQTLTLKNVGSSTLTINSDPPPTGFSVSGSTPINISPQQFTTITVTLNTNSVASYSGAWDLSSNDPSSPFVLNLSGTVQSSSNSGTINVYDGSTQIANGGNDSFGTILTGPAKTKSFTITNTGSSPLNVTSVSLPSDYTTVNTTFPFTVPPNQSSTISVSMGASSVGDYNGPMLIQSSDTSHNPFTINLSGTVVRSTSPSITLADGSTTIANGGSDSFGSVTQGSGSNRTYTVTDWGSNTLSISAISTTGGFSTSPTLPINVTAGNSATFTVSMNTSTVGNVSGTMALTTNDPSNTTFNVSLSGTVTVPPAPIMSLYDGSTQIANGGSDSFGSVTQGGSDSKTFTVKNTGNAALTVSAVNPPTGFSLQTSTPLTVPAGSSQTFVVQMSTATVGSLSGTMTITDTDSNNSPYNVSLSGTVTAPSAPVMSLADGPTQIASGGSDSFGSVTQGTTDTRTYTVSNTGTASLSVSAVSTPQGFSLQTAMPLTVLAGTTATFVVAMNTSMVGSCSGTMAITDSDTNNNPYDVSLSGTVTAPPPLGAVNIQANVPIASELTGVQGQFLVRASTSAMSAMSVNYTVSGTATPGVDYTALSGTVTIPANSTYATFSVVPLTGGDVNEVQQIVLPSPTGGTYSLSIGGNTTTTLAYNANAAAVAAALAGLPEVGVGRLTVSGSGTSSAPFVVTFDGPLGGPSLEQIAASGSQLSGDSSTGSGSGGITTSITTVGYDGGTVVATLASSSNYTIGSPSQDTVTVLGGLPPVITVVATTPTADEVSGTPGTFTLYRNGPTVSALNVNCALSGSTIDGVDYAWVPGTATFAVGQSTTQVTIAPINNGLPSPTKSVVLSLSPPSQGSGPPAYALGTAATSDTVSITNTNLPVVTVFATTPTANEESTSGLLSGDGQFTITRDGDLTNPLTVNYTVGGTAVAGTQYQALSGSVTIAAGQPSATVTVIPIDDGGEGTNTSSTVVLTLSSSSSYQVGAPTSTGGTAAGGSDTVTIDDDDLPQVSIAASTPLAVESTATPGAFTISIDNPQTSDLTIPYTVSGTAVSGTDYTALTGSTTIPAGQTSVVVTVTPLNDPAEVGLTTIQLALTAGSGYQLTASPRATVSIVGNMTVPTVTLAATTPTADEIAGTDGVFTVTRSGSTASALTAYYSVAGTAVNGTDYGLLPGSVTIPAGQASTTIIVSPLADPAMEDESRTVILNLTNYGGPSGASYAIGNSPQANGGGPANTVTINWLPTVSIQATTATAEEHELTPGVFTVTRANDPLQSSQSLTVNYTIGGTAVNGTDYQTLSGTVTIPKGQSSATMTVTPIDMDLVAGSQTVELGLASGGYLISSSAASDTVTINDDDLPTVGIQATTPTASELGTVPGVFTVTRNGPTTNPLTVSYSVSGTGVAGTNYQTLSGTVTIPAGSATATIDVTPIDIGMVGGSFTVVATLSASSAYWLTAVGPTPAPNTRDTVTLEENDLPTVMLQATQNHATESGTTGTFTISRNGTTTNPLIVLYTIGGTAANVTDYTLNDQGESASGDSGYVTIPAGKSYTTITVTPINDPAVEQDQTVVLTLAATSQYVAGSEYTDTVTIFDDNLPSVTVAATANADEATSTSGTFTVTRVGAPDNALTVNYTVGGTAISGTDYNLSGAAFQAVVPAGQSSATISVAPLVDETPEKQQIVIPTATGGTYTLSCGVGVPPADSAGETPAPQTTTPLAFNASAAAVQTALAQLPEVGTGNVLVSGQGTAASPFIVEFVGGLVGVEIPQITADGSQLTGTTSVSVATTTAGGPGVNQVEQVTVSNAVGGTLTLAYQGATTTAIAYNASAATVASALSALSTIGATGVSVTGNAGGPWTVTFVGTLGDQSLAPLTANGSGLTAPAISTSVTAAADGQRTVTVTLTPESTYTIGTLATATASGGTGASDTLTITNPGNNIAPTVVATQWSTTIGESLSEAASGVLMGAQDPNASATLTAVLSTGPADGALTLNSDGSFTYTPNAGFQGTDSFVIQAFDGTTYSVPATVTLSVVPVPAPEITLTRSASEGGTTINDGDTVSFGSTYVGTPLTQTITITNSGTADLDLSSWTAPSGFTIVTAPATEVAAGDSTTMTVELDAATAGSFGGSLVLDWGDDQNSDEFSYTFTVSGTANTPASALEVLQGSTVLANGASGGFSFGPTGQGEPITDAFTVTNVGVANLTLTDPISLPSGFSLASDFGATTLAPGASTTFAVTLSATSVGTYSGNLSFGSNDPNNLTFSLALAGTVVASPVVEVLDGTTVIAPTRSASEGTTVNFGKALVGTALTQTFTIENNGTAALSLNQSQLVLPAGYSVVTPYATSVAAGSSTTLVLEIDGSTAGAFSGSVSFPTNDVDNATFSFPVTGEIDTPEPQMELFDGTTQILPFAPGTGYPPAGAVPAGSTVDFGTTPVGTPVDVTLTVDNVGTADLLIPSAVQLPSDYRLVSWNGQPFPAPTAIDVAPGGSATMILELLGDFAGSYAGAATFYPNDPANPSFSINLTGVVDAPQAQVTLAGSAVLDQSSTNQTATVNFGEATLNSPVVDTFTVTNSGTANLSLTDPIVVPYGYSVVSDFGATSLAPGASTTFAVQLNADTPGVYTGAVAFETNDPDQALYSFLVTGQVATPVAQVSDGSTALPNGGSDDFGNTPLGTPVERTINVTNTGSGVLTLTDPISLPAGFTLVSDFGSTSIEPGDSTSFSVELTAAAAGFFGGELSFGTNGTLDDVYQVAITGGVSVPRLDMTEGTTDVTSYSAPSASENLDLGMTVVGTPRSETFSVTNTGTADLVLSDLISLPTGFTLTQDFGATTLAPGASTTFTVELTATTAGDYSGSISFGTNLPAGGAGVPPAGTTGATFSLPVQGEVIGLSDFRLWNDTGYSETDGHTSDPTVAGNLIGFLPGSVGNGLRAVPTVQFQINNDGNVDGSVQADGTQPFYPGGPHAGAGDDRGPRAGGRCRAGRPGHELAPAQLHLGDGHRCRAGRHRPGAANGDRSQRQHAHQLRIDDHRAGAARRQRGRHDGAN